MSEAKSTETIDGRAVTVWVDVETGLWGAHVDSENLARGHTRKEVIKKARAALRRKKVRLSIPATIVDLKGDGKPLHVIITGLHAQNSDVLYQTAGDNKDKGRLDNYDYGRSTELCPRLDDAAVAEFQSLRHAAQTSAAAFDEWQKQHVTLNRETFVKDAIEEQVKQQGETGGSDGGT